MTCRSKLSVAICGLLCLTNSINAASPAPKNSAGETAVILTPKSSPKPRINGARVF